MDVRLPDGTTIRNIPEGTTQTELARRLKAGGYKVPDEWTAGPKPAAGGAESTPKTPSAKATPAASAQPPASFMDRLKQTPALYEQMFGGGERGPFGLRIPTPPGPGMAMRAIGGAGSVAGELGHRAGGAIAESQLPVPPEVKGGLATAADIGIGTVPSMLAGGGAGAAAGQPLMQSAARKGMQWAIRPENILESDAARAIDTMLEKGLNVSKKGFKELGRQVDELGKEIGNTIAYSGNKVELPEVFKSLKTAYKKAEAFTDARDRFKTIEAAWKEFVNSPLLGGQKRIPVQTALRSKRAISEQLKPADYSIPVQGKEAEAQARSDALKAIQEGERGELLKKEPGIAKPMAEQEKLLNAMDQIERRVIMEARKNPGGLTMFAISRPREFAAFMVDRTSAFKSAIANMLFRNQRSLPAGVGAATPAAGQMIQAPPFSLPAFSMHQPQQQP